MMPRRHGRLRECESFWHVGFAGVFALPAAVNARRVAFIKRRAAVANPDVCGECGRRGTAALAKHVSAVKVGHWRP